jgi:hypothetical protein
VEVKVFPMFALRFGVHNNPSVYSMGLGFNVENIQLDYAYMMHAELDGTHHFTIGYQF